MPNDESYADAFAALAESYKEQLQRVTTDQDVSSREARIEVLQRKLWQIRPYVEASAKMRSEGAGRP